MAEKRRIAFICQDKESARYLLNWIGLNHTLTAVVFEEAPLLSSLVRVLRRLGHDKARIVFGRLAFLAYYRVLEHKKDRSILRRTIRENDPGACFDLPAHHCAVALRNKNINHEECFRHVQLSSPDCILVFGTSILAGSWIDTALPVVNIHYGMPPSHRGSFCGFWALRERKFRNVGVCLHYLNQRVDAGPVVAMECLSEMRARAISSLGELLGLQALLARKVLEAWLQDILRPGTAKPLGSLYFIPTLREYWGWEKCRIEHGNGNSTE